MNAPTAGKILVMADYSLRINCSSPDSDGTTGLYLDDSPISGTGAALSDNVTFAYDVRALSDSVAGILVGG